MNFVGNLGWRKTKLYGLEYAVIKKDCLIFYYRKESTLRLTVPARSNPDFHISSY